MPGKATLWWLGIGVAVALIGWTKAINLLMILGFVLLGLLACQGWAARITARGIRVRPEAGATVFEGESAPISFEVANSTSLPRTFRVDGPHGLRWLFPQLPAGAAVRSSGALAPLTRGVVSPGVFQVASAYPFGVLEYRCVAGPLPDIWVLPALGTIHERRFRQWIRAFGTGDSRQARAVNRRWNSDGDVRGIRPFRTGDNPKDVHWKSTARRGTLFVREYDSTPPKGLLILIDAYAPEGATRYQPLEDALRLAMSLAWEWSRWDGQPAAGILLLGRSEEVIRVVPGHPASMKPLAEVEGSPAHGGQAWLRHAKMLKQAHRILVSSRADSPWPTELAAVGLPAMVAEAAPEWYRPPG